MLAFFLFKQPVPRCALMRHTIRGIDVSHHQPEIDWDAVATQNIQFAYLKATEGLRHRDTRFKSYSRAARNAGIKIGAYHYFSFHTQRSGKDQAANFIATVQRGMLDLPPAVDVEGAGNTTYHPDHEWLRRELRSCLESLTQHYGRPPIIYVNKFFYHRYLRGHFDDYSFWIRDLFFPAGWLFGKHWQVWQYHDRGCVTGIQGPVDLNVFQGDETAFTAFSSGNQRVSP